MMEHQQIFTNFDQRSTFYISQILNKKRHVNKGIYYDRIEDQRTKRTKAAMIPQVNR